MPKDRGCQIYEPDLVFRPLINHIAYELVDLLDLGDAGIPMSYLTYKDHSRNPIIPIPLKESECDSKNGDLQEMEKRWSFWL